MKIWSRFSLRGAAFGFAMGISMFIPAQAYADKQQKAAPDPNTPAVAPSIAERATAPGPQWVKGPYGRLYPVGGWKSCAEAMAHADSPMFKGEIGYNPALDPQGTGLECL